MKTSERASEIGLRIDNAAGPKNPKAALSISADVPNSFEETNMSRKVCFKRELNVLFYQRLSSVNFVFGTNE